MKHRVPSAISGKRMPPWSAEETELLYSLAGDMPFRMLVTTFRRQARVNGWPVRTASALSSRAKKLGLCLRHVHGAMLTSGSIAEILGMSLYAVNNWFYKHHDIPRKKVGPIWYYRRKDLRVWARKHPQLFGGIKPSTLFMLFEDEDLCEWIASNYPHRPNTQPVVCVETGRLYQSHREAAVAHFVDRTTITLAVKTGHAVDGRFRFRKAPP